jgi:hypothetical protein
MIRNFESRGNFEDFGLMNLEKNYRLAVRDLDEYRFKLADFSSVYGQETIKRDEETVKKLENKFSARNTSEEDKMKKKFATIFESVFNTHAELSEWLGSSAYITPAATYDDYVNHIDMIAEFEEEAFGNSHLALGIDVTFSNKLGDKFRRIKDEITTGELAVVKYFKSNNEDFIGQLANIPRVVIAIDPKTITELVELSAGKKNSEMANHWIQFQILEQLLVQIRFFSKYAEKCNQDTVVRKLKINEVILRKIYAERSGQIDDRIKRDGANENFVKQLEHIFRF